MSKVFRVFTKTWVQPYPHCPGWCSKKVEFVRGINISCGWVRGHQRGWGEVISFHLKSGFDIWGQEIGLDVESSRWGCHLTDRHKAVLAFCLCQMRLQTKVINLCDDGSASIIMGKCPCFCSSYSPTELCYHTNFNKVQPCDDRVRHISLCNFPTP